MLKDETATCVNYKKYDKALKLLMQILTFQLTQL